MKHFLAIVWFIALFAVPAISQTQNQQSGNAKCTAKFTQAFSIRGVHLGMSADEVLAMFPDNGSNTNNKYKLERAKDYPYFGRTEISLSASGNLSKEKLAGINHISLTMFDNRVVSYSVTYEGLPNGAEWEEVDDWITKLSETLNLPDTSEWTPISGGKTLNCDGVRITAHLAGGRGNGSFGVYTDDYHKQIREREKAYQEKKRREFKP